MTSSWFLFSHALSGAGATMGGRVLLPGGGGAFGDTQTPPPGRPRKSRGGRTPPLASRGAPQLLGGSDGPLERLRPHTCCLKQ